MPTYEYRCTNCGQHLEVVQAFSDDPLTECPGCQGTLKKVFQPIGIAFRGSGFYKTDSRSSSRSTAKRSGSGGSGDSAGDGGSSGDSAGDGGPSGADATSSGTTEAKTA